MKARNEAVTHETKRQIQYLQSLGWYHSIELPGGEVINGFQTVEQLRARVQQFPIPADLRGKRVLDIGAWDGWFSFEMERRGAEVVAVDLTESEKLLAARELLGSKVDYRVMTVYDLSPSTVGYFDIVLFLGVLYHLKHPLLGLERVCSVARDLVCVESYVTDDGSSANSTPAMEFYESTELCGQFDNWVGPNSACLKALCRAAGLARVKLESVKDNRAHISCFRKWGSGEGSASAPYVVSVEKNGERGRRFSVETDDYVSIWFKTEEPALTPGEVFPEIAEYAAPPVSLVNTGNDGWHVVAKLPPGLAPGNHPVRIRVRDTQFSSPVPIAVDVDPGVTPHPMEPAAQLFIAGISDGITWEEGRIHLTPNACLSVWVRGLPAGVQCDDVTVLFGNERLASVFVSEPDHRALRQINAFLPPGRQPGGETVAVKSNGATSQTVRVELVG